MPPVLPSAHDEHPILIVGQGLAGSTLAWQLMEQGQSIVVIDSGATTTSSRIAAGLLTPITGKRFMLSHRWDELWPLARDFYQKIEQRTGTSFFTQHPAWRLFADEEERTRFEARQSEPLYADRTEPLSLTTHAPRVAASCHDAKNSGFAMLESARLDTKAYLDVTRAWIEKQDAYREMVIDPDNDFQIRPDGVHCKPLDQKLSRVVFCQGYTPKRPRWLSDLEFQPAAGEILSVELPGFDVDRILHCGIWLVPERLQKDTYLLGATHRWEDLHLGVTEVGRDELLGRLASFWQGEVIVKDQQVAIRPTTSSRLPYHGIHADEPRIAWLNGLGGKGSLWAPWCADELARQLTGDLVNRATG